MTSADACELCSAHAFDRLARDSHAMVLEVDGRRFIAPRRHLARWRDLSDAERAGLVRFIADTQAELETGGGVAEVRFVETTGHMHLVVSPPMAHVAGAEHGRRGPLPAVSDAPHDLPLISGGEDALHGHLLPLIDRAVEVELAVSFLMKSGARMVLPQLRDLLERGGRLRLLTGDYLGVTEPDALRMVADLEGDRALHVFQAAAMPFHPKAWMFRFGDGTGALIVGSSNLSQTALTRGVEWNLRQFDQADALTLATARAAFEALLARPEVTALTPEWIDAYEARRITAPPAVTAIAPEPEGPTPEPHGIQRDALAALEATRAKGYGAGLVVLATGLGKTYLAAFDSRAFGRVLFVAHRDEILTQAMATFRAVRPKARLGKYTRQEKDAGAEILFASVQTLSRLAHLGQFTPDAFDYIVVDEFHHAAASTYRRIIEYFSPRFLLGLTATPDRSDGGDLLGLCEENLVYQCDLWEGIGQELLCPFKYYGVPDLVEYAQVPWRNGRFDEAALTEAVATQARAENALEQLATRGGKKAIGFCVSRRHADFMAEFSNARGLRTVAVHSGETSAPRASALQALEEGALDVVYAVDMFNEGVDVPSIDTVLMLRPTESIVIWLQQLGRGLRRSAEKTHLSVIDYIGNHRIFLTKARALLQAGAGERALKMALDAFTAGTLEFPAGCEVTYDLETLDLLKSLIRLPRNGEELDAFYQDFRDRQGVRPTASEMQHAGFDPRRTGHGGWLTYVRDMGDLTEPETRVLDREGVLLEMVETVALKNAGRMVALKAMVEAGQMPGRMEVAALTQGVARMAARNPDLAADLQVDPARVDAITEQLRSGALAEWAGTRWFSLDGDRFATEGLTDGAISGLLGELVDWRIQKHLARRGLIYEQPEVTYGGGAEDPTPYAPAGPKLWAEYMRDEIAPLFGDTFKSGSWNQGIVPIKGAQVLVLLVTLDKKALATGDHYKDHFETETRFSWQSQTSTRKDGKHGLILSGKEPGWSVHLFIRGAKLRDGKAAPFRYAGPVTFAGWEGEAPITVQWDLSEPLPAALHTVFGLR